MSNKHNPGDQEAVKDIEHAIKGLKKALQIIVDKRVNTAGLGVVEFALREGLSTLTRLSIYEQPSAPPDQPQAGEEWRKLREFIEAKKTESLSDYKNSDSKVGQDMYSSENMAYGMILSEIDKLENERLKSQPTQGEMERQELIIAELKMLLPTHISPYNLGDEGRVGELIRNL